MKVLIGQHAVAIKKCSKFSIICVFFSGVCIFNRETATIPIKQTSVFLCSCGMQFKRYMYM